MGNPQLIMQLCTQSDIHIYRVWVWVTRMAAGERLGKRFHPTHCGVHYCTHMVSPRCPRMQWNRRHE